MNVRKLAKLLWPFLAAAATIPVIFAAGRLLLIVSIRNIDEPDMKRCPFGGEVQVPGFRDFFGSNPQSFDYQTKFDFEAGDFLVCPLDGFIFYKDNFTDEELKMLKPLIFSKEFQALKDTPPNYRVAWLHERLGDPPSQIVQSLLKATWDEKPGGYDETIKRKNISLSQQGIFQDDKRLSSLIRANYKRYALELLDWLPKAIAVEQDPGEKLRYRILQGEILRRIDEFDLAKQHFEEMLANIGEGTEESVIAHLELDMIARRDDADREVPSKPLREARLSPARRTADLPILPTGSKFAQVVLQAPTFGRIPTVGEAGYIWDAESRFLIIKHIMSSFDIYPINTEAKRTINLPEYLNIQVLSILKNGNLLLSAVEKLKKNYVLFELNLVSIKQSPVIFYHGFTWPIYISSEYGAYHPLPIFNNIVYLPSDDHLIHFYNTSEKRIGTIQIPSMSDMKTLADLEAPSVILKVNRIKTKYRFMLWNYGQEVSAYSIQCPEEIDSCELIDSVMGKHGILHVEWRDTIHDTCKLRSYDLNSGTMTDEIEEPEPPVRKKDEQYFHGALSISSDDRYLALTCGARLDILDARAPSRTVETIMAPHGFPFGAVEFSPDSRYLAVEIDNVVTVLAAAPE